MNKVVVLLLIFSISAYSAENSEPPSGEQVFLSLFNNGNIKLSKEPLCKADINLYAQLALSLSVSYENRTDTIIKSYCVPSKHDLPNHKMLDIWDCTVQINENSKKGEFISSSTIVFSLTQKKKEFIKGSLRCF